MPLVLVTVNRKKCKSSDLSSAYLGYIGTMLTAYIANALTCNDPGGRLKSEDIEVRFQKRSPSDVGGKQYALEVIVFANDFPSRRKNLDERCEKVRESLRRILSPDVHGYVWIRLAPAAFAEF